MKWRDAQLESSLTASKKKCWFERFRHNKARVATGMAMSRKKLVKMELIDYQREISFEFKCQTPGRFTFQS